MSQNKKFISIGLPVYNGEKTIDGAIESLLSQTYPNFELIISDNGSTDQTAQICLKYVEKDSRVRFLKSDENHGATWNFNRVFNEAKADLFMWASHDDFWHPEFIDECLKGFALSSKVVLSAASGESFDLKTGERKFIDPGLNFIGDSPMKRFRDYKKSLHDGKCINTIFYGIFKRESLEKVMPMKRLIANDHLILAELFLQGEVVTSPKILFQKKWGGASLSHRHNARAQKITNPFLIQFPYFVRELELQKIIFSQSNKTLGIHQKFMLGIWSLGHYGYLGFRFLIRKILPKIR